MKPYLFAIAFFIFYAGAYAQRNCTTQDYLSEHFVLQDKKSPSNFNRLPPRDTFPNEIITIPVVVHVLYKTKEQDVNMEQVLSQLEVLNKDYRQLNTDKSIVPDVFKTSAADSRIMFCLAKVDPDGRATSGIDRKYTDKDYFMADDGMKFAASGGRNAWDPERYLNIWVCRLFSRTIGYATPPGGEPAKDGVVISYDVFGTKGYLRSDFKKGRTATHEIAHWLGLKHIWGDDYCGDDGIDDTPRQKSYNFNCPSFPRATNCSPDANGDMFMNFMDLTSDACMNMFTRGQKNKMRSNFALNGARNSILRSYQCDSSLVTAGPLSPDTIVLTTPVDVISIYPNPVVDYVTVHGKQVQTLKGKTAIIFSASGKPVFQQAMRSSEERIKIGHLPAGIYLLSIGDAQSKTIFKLVKM
jgi:Pregnancy-associated plasma protein-A/Secretion system C-terminal sorting domain